MNKEDLVAFEKEIEQLFLQKKIHAPIHLSRGNEDQLIQIFKEIEPYNWVFSTHRNHLHALLHGIDPGWLKQEILNGHSMHIMNAERRFLASSIVGGNIPIAVGVAMGIKRKGENNRVWCFVGDMAAEHGTFYECVKYARNFDLPICFVIEDNGLSTNTPTKVVWGIKDNPDSDGQVKVIEEWNNGKVLYYRYTRECEHVGVGQWVTF